MSNYGKTTYNSVMTHLITTGFVAASDGLVRYKTDGSFGWIISSTAGERLVRAYGPVHAANPTSYRAEAYGLLLVLRLLVRIQEFCQTIGPKDWKWTATSDNLNLVDVINGTTDEGASQISLHEWTQWDVTQSDMDEVDDQMAAQSTTGQPNPTLEPEWDVLHEIQWTHSKQMHGGTIVHTEGHQDNKAKYETLPLLAQLNIDADELAGKYQDHHGCARPRVLLFPHASAQVHIQAGTIMSCLPFRLRLAKTGPPRQKSMFVAKINGARSILIPSIGWPIQR